ncbi:MAG: chemotaxis protein CheA [Pseudohongiellaceae bacterium]
MLDDDSLAEIKQIFIEEADEGLDIMESGLLELQENEAANELINDIFRAAHSIKGGSATFGFTLVSEFTHLMETLLDQMRDGSREVMPSDVQLLLASVDCLRSMMVAIKDESEADQAIIDDVTAQLEKSLAEGPGVASEPTPECDSTDAKESNSEGVAKGFTIRFEPSPNMLRTGNDPSRIFRELASMGELSVNSDLSALPTFDDLDPETCMVYWNLELITDVEVKDIEEIFDWVSEEAEILITPLGESSEQGDVPDSATDAASVTDDSPKQASSPAEKSKQVQQPKNSKSKPKDGGSIRVGIDKIDSLLNLVGELVITQSMLNTYSNDVLEEIGDSHGKDLQDGLSQLAMNARELQEVAMKMRMLPIKTTFSRFPRLVHDLCLQLGKKIDLNIVGEHTELDKTVLEKIGDPLVHLVRNGLDHGVETPEERIAAGKPETGTLTLKASHEAGNIVIEISDDGKGIDSDKILSKARSSGLVAEDEILPVEKINYLIFHPGLSTAKEVSDVSGRGVGMDVVKRNIQDLGGRVDVQSEKGKGSTFTIRLPLTLAILDGQLVQVGSETYVIPLLSIIETLVVDEKRLNAMVGGNNVYRTRDEYIPIIGLSDVFQQAAVSECNSRENIVGKLLVIVESNGKLNGLVVDELLDQQQVVLKSLESNFAQLDGLSGATILGDGTVSLIVDIPGLIESQFSNKDDAVLLTETAA